MKKREISLNIGRINTDVPHQTYLKRSSLTKRVQPTIVVEREHDLGGPEVRVADCLELGVLVAERLHEHVHRPWRIAQLC